MAARLGTALLAMGLSGAAGAAETALTPEAINQAQFGAEASPDGAAKDTKETSRKPARSAEKRADPLLVRVQVLLDRAGFSPGAIDGRDGDNLRGALAGFAKARGLSASGRLDAALWQALAGTSQDPAVIQYTLTERDVAGPFAEEIPPKMEEQADLKALSYTGPAEMLAERFHMSKGLFEALNPDAPLTKPGTVIAVAAVPALETGRIPAKELPEKPKVSRIEVDKDALQVRAYGEDGALLHLYPASIGSEEKPAPTGVLKVEAVAFDPTYTYNPKYDFKGVEAKHTFTIKPGPNNPVGVVWIDLSGNDGYGIHGTPEPEKIGKTESHGCVRLTNWDARDLARHVVKGAKVDFGK
ncbi:L,D-transpeptidase family protein [Methylobacterium nonmethylotrophicum]|uniref:Murein L,D-transpeptidase n=1 Tax=Methylobacterium nonmethylotrophicum TaxID=1141884 RepID=A0A4Z0NPE6_9HYPH|nr:L,D-transpeptidase family protein [Methylobacterium nonmethylotrophicum]TGD97603.1 murein L,D-transpeptidase [Methylobacterium nonmethylotrophicum]